MFPAALHRDSHLKYEKMAVLKYFKKAEGPSYPVKVSSLTCKQVEQANANVKEEYSSRQDRHGRYSEYMDRERASIGKYTAENGPAKAVQHFSRLLDRTIPETTVQRFKSEYLLRLKTMIHECTDESAVPAVTSLPTKAQGRPLLLGHDLDRAVQDYINALREVGGVVNTAIIMAAAKGIVGAKDPSLLREHGGHIEITKAWA